ncbi:MAG: hypothetical protein JNJ59_23940 [Deltaproteobacteria bacterium]|jgi:hypothetical protein|nr:hypothetical protein [Deltaproteobacteria bacterium]
MPKEQTKKSAALEASGNTGKTDAAKNKAKELVTPGAGYDAQAKQLAPAAAKGGKQGGLAKAELDEWLAVTANILKIKPEGGSEVQEHIARGEELMKQASKDQAKLIAAKIDKIRTTLSNDLVGNG